MQEKMGDIGRALVQGLHLSSPEMREREKAKEADRAAYRRQYWQGYAKRVKRVFGSLTPEEYRATKDRAEEAGRSVWGQIWAEACAYRAGTVLATEEIADQQRQLIAELRRIGNNLNQLARLGHIRARKQGAQAAPDQDQIGTEALQQFEALEAVVAKFDDGISITVRPDRVHDH
ncbi:MAG: hypothetical protein COC12_06395 [Rhodobacteraceae bacterium]|nr:MAG: hypothetical protein COC12_06395 [Paracoccaceae bacterium]